MNRVLLSAAVAAIALTAAPAFAQSVVNGDVDVTGTVAPRCTVIGGGEGNTLAATINLGELTQTNGTLRANLAANTPVGPATVQFTIVCTQSNPTVTLDAQELINADVATAPSGYAKTLDYTADLSLAAASGSPFQLSNATSAAPASQSSGVAVAAGANNVSVSVRSFSAREGSLLTAGTYNGQVIFSIGPSA